MKISRTLLNVGGTVAFGLSLSFSASAMNQDHVNFDQDLQNAAGQFNEYCTQEPIPVDESFDLVDETTFEVLEDSVQTHVWVYDTITRTKVCVRLDQVREGDDRYQKCETHNTCVKAPANPPCEQNQGK